MLPKPRRALQFRRSIVTSDVVSRILVANDPLQVLRNTTAGRPRDLFEPNEAEG